MFKERRYALGIVLLMLSVPFLTAFSCNPVFLTYERAELYGGRGSTTAPARPIVWVYLYDIANGDILDLYSAARAAESILEGCGFRSAGIVFAGSYGERMSPPHQFRLDLAVAAHARSTGYQYDTMVTVDAGMVRAADQEPVGVKSRGSAHYTRQEVAAQALVGATAQAVRPVCYGIDLYQPRSDILISPGPTHCGYGASGRTTKKGVQDMRYDCHTH